MQELLRKIFPGMEGELWFLLWIPVAYLGISLRTVFRPRIVPMIFKILLIVALYGIIMIAVALLFLFLLAILLAK